MHHQDRRFSIGDDRPASERAKARRGGRIQRWRCQGSCGLAPTHHEPLREAGQHAGATYMDKPTTPTSKAEAAVALTVRPDAPHAAELQYTVSTSRVVDGTMIVDQTMEPGTWKTTPRVKLCYWSRNSGGGDTIANDIIDFAPDGVTVTVSAGEGFKSSKCGTWSKVG